MSATDLAASSAAPFLLQDLPNEAVQLIAQHASSPSKPAACLFPLVCRSWRAAADRAQLLWDISLDLAPAYLCPDDTPGLMELQLAMLQGGAAAAAVPTIPSGLLRAGRLAAWLAKNSRSVRSLCISGTRCREVGPAWGVHLRSLRDALTAGPGAGDYLPLPHLVQLELPILGLSGSETMLLALSKCPSLQRLALDEPAWPGYEEGVACKQSSLRGFYVRPIPDCRPSLDTVARAVAPLTSLRVLHVRYPTTALQSSCMAALLRALPANLEDVYLEVGCGGGPVSDIPVINIPVSCITHLVNLRRWEQTVHGPVLDDSNSSSSSGGGSGISSSGAAVMAALTRLRTHDILYSEDARLQLRSLHVLESPRLVSAAWKQLQDMKHLRQLTASGHVVTYVKNRLGVGVPGTVQQQVESSAAGLGAMTQLQHLVLGRPRGCFSMARHGSLSLSAPWAGAVAKLTQLTALELCEQVMVAGASTMLAPLTQLRTLTVDCTAWLRREYYPEGAEGWTATPAGAVVQAVAAAVQGGRGQLQRLVLKVGKWHQPSWQESDREWQLTWQQGTHGEQVQLATTASLPGLLVQVQCS